MSKLCAWQYTQSSWSSKQSSTSTKEIGKLSKTLTWKDELTTNWRARLPSKAHENVAWYIAHASLVGSSCCHSRYLYESFEWFLISLSSLVSCGQRIGCDRLDKYDHQQPETPKACWEQINSCSLWQLYNHSTLSAYPSLSPSIYNQDHPSSFSNTERITMHVDMFNKDLH